MFGLDIKCIGLNMVLLDDSAKVLYYSPGIDLPLPLTLHAVVQDIVCEIL